MMRYVPHILRRLFKPVSLMDAQPNRDAPADPISREIDAALAAHETAGRREREGYDAALAPIDELLARLDSRH